MVALSGTSMTRIAAGTYHTLALETVRSISTTYGYDDMYRLTSGGTPGSPTAYTYDPVGNRQTQTIGQATSSYTYDKADRITGVGSTSYTSNANGNLTTIGSSSTYAFD